MTQLEWAYPDGHPQARRVAFVGDSITAWSLDQIRWLFADCAVVIRATPGIGMGPALHDIQELVALQPDLLVIELGVNNLGDAWTAGDANQEVAILNTVGPVPDVLWVLVGAKSPSYYDGPSGTTLRQRISMLRHSLTRHIHNYPNVRIADFSPTEIKHSDWFAPDGLHLSRKGAVAFAHFISDHKDKP